MLDYMSTESAFGHEADLYNVIKEIGRSDTPFFSTISSGAPSSRSNAYQGHEWKCVNIPDGDDTNEHHEGDVPATATHEEMFALRNEYQIIKDTIAVSGSEDAAVGIDGKKELARQLGLKSMKHRRTIEKALLSSKTPVKRNEGASIKGRLGGLKSFLSASTDIDMAGLLLEWKHIREILKVGFLGGSPFKSILLPDIQKDRLDDILWDKTTNMNMAASELQDGVVKIKNTSYGSDISLRFSPDLDDSEIIGFTPSNIHAILWRPTKTYDIARTSDGIKKEIITELTLRFGHTYAAARMKNLKV